MFQGIQEVLPGHTIELSVESALPSVRRYWQCSFPFAGEHHAPSWKQASDELLAVLKRSVYSHLYSDVPIGLYLSGGLDSSVLSAIVREITGDPPVTFSISFDSPRFDEMRMAAEVNQHLGVHGYSANFSSFVAADVERMIWHAELPLQFPLAVPLMRLAELARSEGYRVVLTGEGPDELFGGYDCFRGEKMRRLLDHYGVRRFKSIIYKQLYKWHDIPVGTVQRMIDNDRSVDAVRESYGGIVPPWYDMWTTVGIDRARLLGVNGFAARSDLEPPAGFHNLVPRDVSKMDPHDAAIALEIATRLPSWILLIGDRASMSAGVEARVPYLGHEVVEFIASLPPRFKLRRLREKALLRHSAKNLLPRETIKRGKRPFFTPIREWFFRDDSPEIVRELMSSKAISESGLFDPELVERFKRQLRVVPSNLLVRHQLEWTLMLVLGVQILNRQFVTERCAIGPQPAFSYPS